jgi:hypothetical protein
MWAGEEIRTYTWYVGELLICLVWLVCRSTALQHRA